MSPYFYIDEGVGDKRLARMDRVKFEFVDALAFNPATDIGGWYRNVLRKSNNHRNIAYKDADGNSYTCNSHSAVGGPMNRVIKFNLETMTKISELVLDAPVTTAAWCGVIDEAGEYSYWCKHAATGYKFIYKVRMSDFSIYDSIITGFPAQGFRSLEMSETDGRLYAISWNSPTFYPILTMYAMNPLSYLGITSLTGHPGGGYGAFGDSCLTKVGNKLIWIMRTSTGTNSGPSRIIKAELPLGISSSSLILDTDETANSMCIDSEGKYAYLMGGGATVFWIIKIDISTTPMERIDKVIMAVPGGTAYAMSICIDERMGYLYASSATTIFRIKLNTFEYIDQLNLVNTNGHFPYYDIFTED
jgi:hypothetical protein